MSQFLSDLSFLSRYIIAIACAVHLAFFAMLWVWSKRDLKGIASFVEDFTHGMKHRSVLGATGHLSDQIEAFIADINDTLENHNNRENRAALLNRMNILDEKRRYLHSMFFDTCYNICRTMIEAYPLAGVLGTILAIGTAMQSSQTANTVSTIVDNFGDAIWSTFVGLASAILLMFLNSFLEPPFGRLSENRQHVREMVSRAKRELSFHTGEQV